MVVFSRSKKFSSVRMIFVAFVSGLRSMLPQRYRNITNHGRNYFIPQPVFAFAPRSGSGAGVAGHGGSGAGLQCASCEPPVERQGKEPGRPGGAAGMDEKEQDQAGLIFTLTLRNANHMQTTPPISTPSLIWLSKAAIQQIHEGPVADATMGADALHQLLAGTLVAEAAENLAVLHAKARDAAGRVEAALETLHETQWP